VRSLEDCLQNSGPASLTERDTPRNAPPARRTAPRRPLLAESTPLEFALTFHVEGPRDRPSAHVYRDVQELAEAADALAFDIVWLSEHHSHIHLGHVPSPITFASFLLGRTERLKLGTAVICLNLHHPIDLAEQIAVADVASGGRFSPGFGSGGTRPEYQLFGNFMGAPDWRHGRFAALLDIVAAAWQGDVPGCDRPMPIPAHQQCPIPPADLPRRVWIAANSEGAARICAERGYNLLMSCERSEADYQRLRAAWLDAGGAEGAGGVSAGRPIYIGEDDDHAWEVATPAIHALWDRKQGEGKLPRDEPKPATVQAAAERMRFLVGGPQTCLRRLRALHEALPYTNLNLEPRWEALPQAEVLASLQRCAQHLMPAIRGW